MEDSTQMSLFLNREAKTSAIKRFQGDLTEDAEIVSFDLISPANALGKPDWSHIIPYYAEDMEFKDSIQYINGKEEFTAR